MAELNGLVGMASVSPAQVRDRLGRVSETIAAAAGGRHVTVVAVTKGHGPEVVRAAVEAGMSDLGENYAQEIVQKAPLFSTPQVRWHYLGALQANKLRRLAPLVWCWQGVSSLREGERLVSVAPGARVMVQVDFVGSRQGCLPVETAEVVAGLERMGLNVTGLMTVAPPGGRELARSTFAELARMGRDLGLADLSMGMSEDFEVAVEEGATLVRLGTALFGPRPPRASWGSNGLGQ